MASTQPAGVYLQNKGIIKFAAPESRPGEEPGLGVKEESEAEPAEENAPPSEEPDASIGPTEEPGMKPLDLNEALRKFESQLREVLGDSIECTCLLDPTIPFVYAESSDFEKMMLTIAQEASREIEGSGQFTIETGRSEDDTECLAKHGIRRREPCVRVSVNFTGMGMDEALLRRIFVPLDAVEGKVERTPVSMSAVYDLVGRNRGHVDVFSERGFGTTVRSYLLRVPNTAEREESRLSGVAGVASGC